jgi:hypothetical protein
MKVKNLLVFVLLGSGLVYGGLKGYIHYKVKKQVDTLVAAAAPFADIEYGSIGSTLDGSISVEDIVLYPRGINDPVRLDRLRLVTPGLDFLLRGAESMRAGELPERMGMELRGARLSLNGRLVQALEEAEVSQSGLQPSPEQLCSLSRTFLTARYRELGMTELVFDNDLQIERGLSPSQVVMKMVYSLRGVEQGEAAVTLAGVGNDVMSVAVSTPRLHSVSISYRPDPVLARKALDYCAGLKGTDVPGFITQLFDNSDDWFAEQLGFVPGPGIRAALRQLMENPGELRLRAQPHSPLDMKSVHLYKPEDWPDLFGLIVTVNDTEVRDLSFRMPLREASEARTKSSAFQFPALALLERNRRQESPEATAAVKRAQSETPSGRPRYRQVNRQEVAKLVGKTARISTVDGKRRSGRILSVTNGIISLQLRLHGGTLSTEVPIARARKIEVLETG